MTLISIQSQKISNLKNIVKAQSKKILTIKKLIKKLSTNSSADLTILVITKLIISYLRSFDMLKIMSSSLDNISKVQNTS